MNPAAPAGLAPQDVTRLARVTGLDRLGIPVWQAVRPLGRSLSCHMGKGMDEAQAIASALGEAREYADCEAYRPVRTQGRWDALPAEERSGSADDFAVRRGAIAPDMALDWTRVETLDGPALWVPSDAIAMDFTLPGHPGVLCASAGQATAASFDTAMVRALLELIERDAVARFRAMSPGERLAWAIDPESVQLDWFGSFLTRARSLRMVVGIDRLPAINALPAYQLWIAEANACSAACRSTGGWGAAFTTPDALQAAMLEAAQSRVGYIAGARDDMALGPAPATEKPDWLARAASRRFRIDGDAHGDAAEAVRRLQKLLAKAGFDRIGYVITSAAGAPYTTVKCFVPGLALGERAAAPPSAMLQTGLQAIQNDVQHHGMAKRHT